jgi:hypothetical protein
VPVKKKSEHESANELLAIQPPQMESASLQESFQDSIRYHHIRSASQNSYVAYNVKHTTSYYSYTRRTILYMTYDDVRYRTSEVRCRTLRLYRHRTSCHTMSYVYDIVHHDVRHRTCIMMSALYDVVRPTYDNRTLARIQWHLLVPTRKGRLTSDPSEHAVRRISS